MTGKSSRNPTPEDEAQHVYDVIPEPTDLGTDATTTTATPTVEQVQSEVLASPEYNAWADKLASEKVAAQVVVAERPGLIVEEEPADTAGEEPTPAVALLIETNRDAMLFRCHVRTGGAYIGKRDYKLVKSSDLVPGVRYWRRDEAGWVEVCYQPKEAA